MQVTHPFHPHSGRRLVCAGKRSNPYGTRLLLEVDGRICAVPRQWTDLVAPDPEVVLGEGRSPVRVRDLMDLARLVGRLAKEISPEGAGDV